MRPGQSGACASGSNSSPKPRVSMTDVRGMGGELGCRGVGSTKYGE